MPQDTRGHTIAPVRDCEGTGVHRGPRFLVFDKLVGGPGFEPGPHGPELCELPSRNGRNDRFQFETSDGWPSSVQIWAVLSPDYYMNYYT
jgi:hypothetical protein